MRLIQVVKDKPMIEVRWMWLPTFIGQNQQLLGLLDEALRQRFKPPFEADDAQLDEIHEFVIEWLAKAVPVPGIKRYLAAITEVEEQ